MVITSTKQLNEKNKQKPVISHPTLSQKILRHNIAQMLSTHKV